MNTVLNGLREIWREIDRNPPHAPPGCETGGGIAFIFWFGGLAIFIGAMILR